MRVWMTFDTPEQALTGAKLALMYLLKHPECHTNRTQQTHVYRYGVLFNVVESNENWYVYGNADNVRVKFEGVETVSTDTEECP